MTGVNCGLSLILTKAIDGAYPDFPECPGGTFLQKDPRQLQPQIGSLLEAD